MYSKLEPTTLKEIPLPVFTEIKPAKLERYLLLAKQRISGKLDSSVDIELDNMVSEFYQLGDAELKLIYAAD